MKNKKSNNKKNLYIVISIVVIMIILLIVILTVTQKRKNTENNSFSLKESNQAVEEELTQEEEIKTLSESSRMKRYVGIFFDNIENKDYQSAYNILNQEFKDTYFPTLNDFKEYANKYFDMSTVAITYDNIERLGNNKTGNMYVLWLSIGNIYQPKLAEDEEMLTTNFVIIEKNIGDYEMSFSVVEE